MQCAHAARTALPQLHADASLSTRAEYRMSRYGVTPNMLVLPPQMLLYMVRGLAARTATPLCAFV